MGNKVENLSEALEGLTAGNGIKVQFREYATDTAQRVSEEEIANTAYIPENIKYFLGSKTPGYVLIFGHAGISELSIEEFRSITITFDCCPK